MKISSPSLKTALSLIFTFSFILVKANVFYQLDFEKAKNLASKEHKLLMLKFTAEWCLPCKFMDKTVFADTEITAYMSERVVAIQVDIDQFSGMDLKELYKIKRVPTIIFIHPNGNEISRKENSMGIADFKTWVESLVSENHINPSPNSLKLDQKTIEQSHSKNDTSTGGKTNQGIQNPDDTQKVKLDTPGVHSSHSTVTNPAVENTKIDINDESHKQIFGTYYVQLGAFSEMENAMKAAEDMDNQFSQNASILESQDQNGKSIFKLNLGPFDSEEEAEVFVQVLKDRKIESMVKKSEF